MTSDDEKAPQKQEPKLSLQQLQDVRDRLKQPLTDRSVLIPCGTKAFFAGRLTPSTAAAPRLEDDAGDGKPAAAAAAAAAAALSECVIIRMADGTEKEMARQEALDHLQKEIEERKQQEINEAKAALAQKVLPPPKKKAVTQTSSNRASSSEKQAVPFREANAASMLPFIEIREELDESGQAIRCETIDVSEQLENLKSKGEKEISSSFGSGAVQEEDDEMDEKAAARAMSTPSNSAVDPNDNNKPKSLSDSEYDALAARLDELAKLEEQAEANKSVNIKSSKKLQSKGWSKGFLNNSPTKKLKKKQVPPQTAATDVSNTSTAKVSPALATNPAQDAPSSKTVAFGDTEIREIPRVGERSVRATVPRPISRPLEEAVFPGVVQEKKSAAATGELLYSDKPKKVSRFAQERQASSGSAQQQQQPQASKKKVSRFAQERQQGLR